MIVCGSCECGERVTIDYPERAVKAMLEHVEEEHPGRDMWELVEFSHRGRLIPRGTILGEDGQVRILA